MRQVEGWRKRSDRLKELPKAVQLLEEAEALAASACDPAHPGESQTPARGQQPAPEDPGPRFRGDERSESQPFLTDPPALSAIDRLEALVLKEIAAAETARERVTDKRQLDKVSETSARTLATLTQTLRTLQQMRTGKPIDTRTTIDDDLRDDMPRDLDEFRLALARRIEALFASETDVARAEENSGGADSGAPE